MNKIININSFLLELRLNAGAIWLENETINFSVPKKFQNQETKDFILEHKSRIISILSENHISSKEKFLNVPIYKDTITTNYPLSPAQERLWFIEKYEGGINAYHMPLIFELDRQANIQGVKYAIHQIISRHEVLRSTLHQGDDHQGIQTVHEELLSIEDVWLTSIDICETLITEDINRPFDLSSEYPIRVKFYKIESTEDRNIVLVNIHHIACDGWSMEIFQKELFAYYRAYLKNDTGFSLPALVIQYKDYAAWQRSYLTGRILADQLYYWKNKLSGYQILELPIDCTRPNMVGYRGANQVFKLTEIVSNKLRALAQHCGVTLHSVMLSSINILFSKYTGQEDIIIGSPIANRHYRQTEELIGFFVNSLVNRTLLSKSQSFHELIQQVYNEQIAAQLYQDLPFEKLIDELGVDRDTSRHPIFQVMFAVQSFGNDSYTNDEFGRHFKPFQGTTSYAIEKFDLSIYINDHQEALTGRISYATGLFHKETIARLIDHYIYMLTQLVEAPHQPYSKLSLLRPEEYNQIVYQWNVTEKDYPKDKTIYQLFQEQVEKTPDHVALVYEDKQLSYKQLNEKSNQLARHIREQYQQKTKQELKPDTLIALCLDRSLEMVIGILAVLKAGGAYVPIDPSHPKERIDYLLKDTDAKLVLSQRHLKENNIIILPADKIVYIDLSEDLYQKNDGFDLPSYNTASDLAYVLYTSGTTGKPKGVMLAHTGIVNRLEWMQSMYPLNDHDVVLQKTPYVFDVSVWEILWANWYGAKIVIAKPEGHKDSDYLHQLIQRNRVTTLHFVPSMLEAYNHFLQERETKFSPYVRQLFCSGEALAQHVVDRTYKNTIHLSFRLHNLYGPTEASIDVTFFETHADGKVYIGKPIQNTQVYVLAPNNTPVPIGVIGELYIGGAGLARGYLNNKALTEERFIPNPFATAAGKAKGYTRLFKTGDLVRWQADGNLEYIGRNDDQVKIRGYRIELAEIEHALLQIPGISQTCVLAKERKTESGNTKYLAGYYIAHSDSDTLDQITILQKLSSLLPDYMVPSALVAVESFPLTINGKLDKRALPDPDFNVSDQYVAPTSQTETAICKIWQEVLGLERVSITDDFFRIGGDSILSIQLSTRIRQAGFNCQVKDIFLYKTIEKLAKHLLDDQARIAIKSEQHSLTGTLGLLPIQQWFIQQVDSGAFAQPNHWNQSFLIKVPLLDKDKLAYAMEQLVAYHDVLRIQYIKEQNWQQLYQSSILLPGLRTLDVSQHTRTQVQEILTHWQSGFDLQKGPLFAVGYLYGYQDGSARIFLALHHMIVDAVSWRILTQDIKNLYEGKTLPAKGSSYRQWVETVKDYAQQHPDEQAYWKAQLQDMPAYDIPGHQQTNSSATLLELNKTLTTALLQNASKAYHTQINDLLLTALAYALKDINQNEVQGITLEGHGREAIDPSIDHSHTVGWFTTMFPVKLELSHILKQSIQSIKESLRTIPNKGIGFGTFATGELTDYTHNDLPPISFNYLGQFDTHQHDWQISMEGSGINMHPANIDHNLININGMVRNGKLSFSMATQLGEQTTKQLSDSFKAHLTTIIKHCQEKLDTEGSSYTPSDFSTVSLSQSLLDSLQSKAKAAQNEITHIYPASSLQQGFIYHASSQTQDDAYRLQILFDYHQAMNIDNYIKAWWICIEQYPILRTAFNWEGQLIQIIYKHGQLQYQLHDISDLPDQQAKDARIEAIQQQDRKQSFDLTKPTLLRLHIIKQAQDYYTVLKTDHHSIADGWSGPVLLTHLHQHYQALTAKRKVTIKQDTAYLEAQDYITNNKARLDDYWNTALAHIDGPNDINALLSKPIDLTSYKQVTQPAITTLQITGQTYKALKSLSQTEGITINVIVQFAWHKLLQIYSSSTKSIVGTTVSGRDLPIKGIEESVGLYINTLPLVIHWENDNTIQAQLHHIQEQITAINTHSFAHLAGLQKDGQRLFHSLFIFENYPRPKQDGIDTPKISIRNTIEKIDYPLGIIAYEHNDAITIQLNYDGKYLTKDKANSHIITLESILSQVIENPKLSHSKLSLLTPKEYNQIVCQWNATEKDYPKDKTIYELFQEQVEKTPDQVALVYEDKQLSYNQLNEKSNQLARHIREQYQQKTKQELKPDTLIALCLDRSLEMVIGILAVLKAGGAYVPIDPSYPKERIDYLLEDTDAQLLLTQRNLNENGAVDLPVDKAIYIDLSESLYQEPDTHNLPQHSTAADLAYVIYTSGTTGKPKGVMVEHRNYLQLNYANKYDSYHSNRTIWTNYTFDVSVFELFNSLLSGSKLFVLSNDVRYNSRTFFQFLKESGINYSYIPPFFIRDFVDYLNSNVLGQLEKILTGVEKIHIEDATRIASLGIEVLNGYGPSETTTCSTAYVVGSDLYPFSDIVPIGIPLSNEKIYVLDSNKNPVPIGVIGEMYIGGAGLSRGYLHNQRLTAERFVPNPFATESDKSKGYTRLYKTGDLVRWLPDGNLEYIGRNDDQVKIRGYRIELAEIEHALLQIPGISQTCVLAKERKTESGNTKYLVGYYIAHSDSDILDQITILQKLSSLLPDYMVPSALVAVESFPLTINGKLDKRALPDPDFNVSDQYVAPTSQAETAICKIWQEVLGLGRVGITDDFFKIGGNSIMAMRVSHRMTKSLGRDVKIADVFKYKSISELLTHGVGECQISIPKTDESSSVLSFSQERLWFIEQYEQGTDAYHIPVVLELKKNTNIAGIKYALEQIVLRHEVLRTTIEHGIDQQGIQVVHNVPLTIQELQLNDKDDLEAIIKEDIKRPFDLKKEYPFRVKFYKIQSDESKTDYPPDGTIILMNTHHIASDEWSKVIFQREFAAYYEAYLRNDTKFSLPTLEIQYKDYALWQRSYLTGETLKNQLSYWRNKLSGYQLLEFPTDYGRPAQIDYKGAYEVFSLDKNIGTKLRGIAKSLRVTLHSVMLSSINVLLSKYTWQEDIVIGKPIANRSLRQTEGLIGFFVNTQINRTQLSKSKTFEDLIYQVHQEQIEAQLHQDLPFEKLVDELVAERDPSRHPIFQVMFVFQDSDSINEVTVKEKTYFKPFRGSVDYAVEKFDLTIYIDASNEEFTVRISYAKSLFRKETIIRLNNHYRHLLAQLVEAPGNPYRKISLLHTEEYEQILCKWNATDKYYPRDKTIYNLFEQQADKTPNNIALIYKEQAFSYRHLNEKSNQLARYIRKRYRQRAKQELKPDTLIALCLDRSSEMIVGILGVLKAGGAYVPIDVSYPKERINYLLADTNAELILCQRQLDKDISARLPQDKVIFIDLFEDFYQLEDGSNLPQNSSAKDLVYVIYTSGTTGKPKGVMLEHFSICNRVLHIISYSNITASDFHLFKTNYVFDASFFEIFTHLCVGATIQITEHIFDIGELNKLLLSGKFTSLHLVPSQFDLVLSTINSIHLRKIYFSGEPLTGRIISDIDKNVKIYNYYGPTELGEITVHTPLIPAHAAIIGKLFPNCRHYVLDQNKTPVPIGVTGELYIGGDGIARGYLNKKELTAERFILNSFATKSDRARGYTKLYKTGDLVRWLADGNLEYIGRNDDQVKIRGYRIELGEIEHALTQIPGIKQSCVLVKERYKASGNVKYLVGYYVPDTKSEVITEATILDKLSVVLPDYMVPSTLVAMESFPLTTNGKLDKRALPTPNLSSTLDEYVAPTTDIEISICKIWREALAFDQVGIADNFFRIGGSSILAITVISRIKKELSIELTIKELFLNATIKLLSKLIQTKTFNESASSILLQYEPTILSKEDEIYEILPSQTWRYHQYKEYMEYKWGVATPMNLIIQNEENNARRLVMAKPVKAGAFSHEQLKALFLVSPGDVLQRVGIYHSMNSIIYREIKNVNEKAFAMAIDTLVVRHESLRTLFVLRNGKAFQRICSENKFISNLSFKDICGQEHRMEEIKNVFDGMQRHLFDLENEQPFKCILLKYETDKYVFIFVVDHIINDAQSLRIIEEELFILYTAYSNGLPNPLQPLKLQFKHYVSHHNRHCKGDKLANHQSYFRKLFNELPPKLRVNKSKDFATGLHHLNGPVISENCQGAGYAFMVSREILDQIMILRSDLNVSFFNFLLAAYTIFLKRISSQSDFVIDSPMSTRTNEDFSKIIGWLTGVLISRVEVDYETNFKDLVLKCKNIIIEGMDHIYYQDITNLLGVEWDQLVSAQLNIVDEKGEIEIERFRPRHYVEGHVSSTINFTIRVLKNGLLVNCTYRTSEIKPSEIAVICENFILVLKMAVKSPDIKIKSWDKFDSIIPV